MCITRDPWYNQPRLYDFKERGETNGFNFSWCNFVNYETCFVLSFYFCFLSVWIKNHGKSTAVSLYLECHAGTLYLEYNTIHYNTSTKHYKTTSEEWCEVPLPCILTFHLTIKSFTLSRIQICWLTEHMKDTCNTYCFIVAHFEISDNSRKGQDVHIWNIKKKKKL